MFLLLLPALGLCLAMSLTTYGLDVAETLKHEEGFRATAYEDNGGWSIGYGHHVGFRPANVWTEAIATRVLDEDIETATTAARYVYGLEFDQLEAGPKTALILMAYQMGGCRLGKFTHMLYAMHHGDWSTACAQALDSQWAEQTPQRARRVAALFLR
jgi:lysozyme